MRITYLYHDCFLLEFERFNVITDYFKSVPINPLSLISSDKPLYVLVSHHHKDHFSPEIFSWNSYFTDINYIISEDAAIRSRHFYSKNSTYKGPNKTDERLVTVLRPGEKYEDSEVRISAFGSTDIGNSYVIEADGLTIFFAGDLNAWTWRDESTVDEIEEMLSRFNQILEDISRGFSRFDVVLFPVDPRMGKDSIEGILLFCQLFDVKQLIPMHFELWKNESEREEFLNAVQKAGNKIEKSEVIRYIPLITPGDNFIVTK